MRIDSVTARAFGPFHGEQLDLAPGLTIVAGPNEAGKSTWHAAVRAAICGMPRRRGRATAAEQEFAELHKPWDGSGEWLVSARLALDGGGRCVEIRQDLGERLDSSAIELPIGRSVTGEILNDGSPDASRWLGLDRDAFAATVCVDQADILAVAAAAGSLQQHLQRAAATRGSDATAAEAIERLKRFRSEHVGLDRPNAVRPLRQATELLDASRQALEAARAEHATYLELAAAADEARQAHARSELRLRSAEAGAARLAAEAAVRRARRARALAARHPSEPPGAPERDRLADDVAAAIAGWTGRPGMQHLPGPNATDLQAQLEGVETELLALRDVPPGDVTADPAVRNAREAWVASRDAVALLGEAPPVPQAPPAGLSSAELESLAADLDARAPEPGGSTGAASPAGGARPAVVGWWAAVAGLAAVLGAAVAVGAALAGVLPVAAAGAVVAVVAFVAWMRTRSSAGLARGARRYREAALDPETVARAAADARRADATQRLRRAGISETAPDMVRSLAARTAAAESAARARADWESRMSLAMGRMERARDGLAAALLARGVQDAGEVEAAWRAYEAACAARAARATAVSRADALRSALATRRQAEAQARAAARATDEARDALTRSAEQAGVPVAGVPEAEIVAALRAWQGRRERGLRATSEARAEWEQLQALLDGRTPDDLEARAAALVRVADDREREVAALGGPVPVPAAVADDGMPDVNSLAAEERRLLDEARSLAGAAADRASRLHDVAEAEEAVQRAEEELARVQRLDAALVRTAELLAQAQDRVHRDIAPVLATAIRARLGDLTAGRYDDAAVDPATLSVQVREQATGRWRHAQRLSQGTREQVYLLLRAAMAQHLVTTAEAAPLLLDEVTAQADDQRKAAMLAALLAMSAERQVILFTHDREVVEWARVHLDPSRDRLIELPDRAALPA